MVRISNISYFIVGYITDHEHPAFSCVYSVILEKTSKNALNHVPTVMENNGESEF